MQVNLYQDRMNNITFSGVKPKKDVVTKVIRQGTGKIDYGKFDPYFLRILIDEGCSISEIAHDIKQKESTTRSILAHFNLKTQLAMLLDVIKPEELKKMLDAKKSQKEIAEHFMIDDAAALTPLIKKVGERPATKAKVDSIPKEDLQKLADDGFSYEKIGEFYKIAAKYIKNKMKEFGIKTKQELAKEKTIAADQLKHYLFDLDLSVSEISTRKGIKKPKIYQMLKENNIKTSIQESLERIPTKEEFLMARKECDTLKEYAEKLKITTDKAKKFMVEYNIKPFHVTIKDPCKILELLKKNPNMSVDEIAKELDIPPRSIDAAVSKFRIPIMHTSSFGVYTFDDVETAKRFNRNFAMGDTIVQLGEQYGRSAKRIVELVTAKINPHLKRHSEYNPSLAEHIVRDSDLTKFKLSPDKTTVENCIKKIGGSWKEIDEMWKISFAKQKNIINKICKELKVSDDTLNYLVKKYNIE